MKRYCGSVLEAAEVLFTELSFSAEDLVRIKSDGDVALGVNAAEHPTMFAAEDEIVRLVRRQYATGNVRGGCDVLRGHPHRRVGRNHSGKQGTLALKLAGDALLRRIQPALKGSRVNRGHAAWSHDDSRVLDEVEVLDVHHIITILPAVLCFRIGPVRMVDGVDVVNSALDIVTTGIGIHGTRQKIERANDSKRGDRHIL